MGSSSETSSDHVALIALVLLLLGTCTCDASDSVGDVAAAPVLKVANHLGHGAALTVLRLLGCSSLPCECPPTPLLCPGVSCALCEDVVVENGGTEAVRGAPHPLPYLMVQGKEAVYCVERSALELIQAWGTLAVGPGACGSSSYPGLAASIRVEKTALVAPLCLYGCNRG